MADKKEQVEFTTFVVEAFKYQTTLNKTFHMRKPYKPADPNEIRSLLPGTIREIGVKEGAKVRIGDEILIFEAMKMNNSIKAHKDGVVKKIHVTLNEQIMKNQLLVEIV